MNEEKRYQIFISSTFADLEEERRLVMEAIISLHCFPAGMEMFPATDTEQLDYIKGVIKQSDYYVLILAGRYGTLAEDGISFTEKEYQYAVENAVPVLAFIRENIDMLPSKNVDENRKKLEKFKNKVKQGRLVRFWNNPAELKFLITDSLRNAFVIHPRKGWVQKEDPLFRDTREGETPESEYEIDFKRVDRAVTIDGFLNDEEVKRLLSSDKDLPLGYNIHTGRVYSIDLSKTYCYAISGKRRTGKTNALKVLISAACAKKDEVYVIELSKREELKKSISSDCVNMANSIDEALQMYQHLVQIYLDRNKTVIEYITKGYSDKKIFSLMQRYPRVHIFIDDLELLLEQLRGQNDKRNEMYWGLHSLLIKGKFHNVFYYYALNQSSSVKSGIGIESLYNAFTDGVHGIHFGGEIMDDRILNFSPPYIIANKIVKPGIGYVKDYDVKSDSIFLEDEEFFILLPLYQ